MKDVQLHTGEKEKLLKREEKPLTVKPIMTTLSTHAIGEEI